MPALCGLSCWVGRMNNLKVFTVKFDNGHHICWQTVITTDKMKASTLVLRYDCKSVLGVYEKGEVYDGLEVNYSSWSHEWCSKEDKKMDQDWIDYLKCMSTGAGFEDE